MKPHYLFLCAAALLVPSCTTVNESSNSYIPSSSAGKPAVSGAAIAGEFIPSSSHAGSGAGSGPFKFALYATGGYGTHRSMTVHSLTYRWSSGVRDSIPAAYTGRSVTFRNSLASGVTQATWHAPGELNADFSRESAVTVEADVSVNSRRGTERRIVSLKFDRTTQNQAALQAAPTELVRQAKMRNVPFSDLDIGANRLDWQP